MVWIVMASLPILLTKGLDGDSIRRWGARNCGSRGKRQFRSGWETRQKKCPSVAECCRMLQCCRCHWDVFFVDKQQTKMRFRSRLQLLHHSPTIALSCPLTMRWCLLRVSYINFLRGRCCSLSLYATPAAKSLKPLWTAWRAKDTKPWP